jgi:hypothetical protein
MSSFKKFTKSTPVGGPSSSPSVAKEDISGGTSAVRSQDDAANEENRRKALSPGKNGVDQCTRNSNLPYAVSCTLFCCRMLRLS